jgi:hypothetical protein
LVALSACSEGGTVCEEAEQLPEGRAFQGAGALGACPGHPDHLDFVAACEGVVPRVKVTVRDERGAPVEGALVFPFPQTLEKNLLDPVRFPALDGLGQTIGYDACTNESGVAVLCGFGDAVVDQVRVVAPRHAFFATGSIAMTSTTVIDLSVALTRTSAPEPRVLVMTCEPHHREPTLLQRANIPFAMAPIGSVVDELPRFDVLVVGFACNKHESFGELLVRERNAALLEWVARGGLLFIAQQNDARWSRGTGCPCEARACPKMVLPPAYRFELLPENEKCNDYTGATVAAADPLVDRVPSWEGWRYTEQIAPDDQRSFVCLDCIDGSSVDRSVWDVLLTARPTAGDARPKAECPARALGPYDADGLHVALMKARYGDGLVVVAHHAWEQGSEGVTVPPGGFSDPNAEAARDAVLELLRGGLR